jgi:uncharacterized protein (TIGR00290 family)
MNSPRSVVVSWSGGKDSALALDAMRHDPAWRVVGLLTSVTQPYDRVSVHGVRRTLLHAQAASLGLPITEIVLTPDCSNDAYDAAFATALATVRRANPGVRHVAFGDLFLADVRQYREERVAPLGFDAVFPLWERDTAALAREFVAAGFEARLVCVDTTQLDGAFAGRRYDDTLLGDLPPTVDPCGERGEFHTFVSAGPGFTEPIPYTLGGAVLRDDRFMYCDLY